MSDPELQIPEGWEDRAIDGWEWATLWEAVEEGDHQNHEGAKRARFGGRGPTEHHGAEGDPKQGGTRQASSGLTRRRSQSCSQRLPRLAAHEAEPRHAEPAKPDPKITSPPRQTSPP